MLAVGHMAKPNYDEAFVKDLFDRMGPTYDLVNLVSSAGFSALWRRTCVQNAGVRSGEAVCDMMAGSGECWTYIESRGGTIVSVDFSPVMAKRQVKRMKGYDAGIRVLCEDALHTSVPAGSIDCVVSAFGLKTLSHASVTDYAREVARILRPGGRVSLIEISTAENWWLAPVYRWYVNQVIPAVGKICLGDIECYRMLGEYTAGFGSCDWVAPVFAEAGFDVSVARHFFGCATSIVGSKRSQQAQLPADAPPLPTPLEHDDRPS
jgi:demethylmenaquinone methyltransferase/2-methoxy-6-polyprenyl-1,4-benzoquinol methylase